MGWTSWRKIAEGRTWFSEGLDHDGPACYEIAVAGPHGGDLRLVYVGETSNERKRIASYAAHGSHLSKIIDYHLRQGWSLWYRAQAMPSKSAAVAMQNRMLGHFDYDWNIQLNASSKR